MGSNATFREWLEQHGLGRHADALLAHDIAFDVLPDLGERDLANLGLSVGDRIRLRKAIAALPAAAPACEPMRPRTPAVTPEGAERRQLTVLFCDLVGSTALSLKLDPEELREVIRAYQDVCAAVIDRFSGHIARFLGDGILAYFGYPRAHEDDAEWALRAALELVEAVAKLRAPGGAALQVRIGVATGRVVVGDLIGQGAATEETVVGATPHLAARLQTLAKPGEVVIAAATHELVGGFFTYADLGQHRLKGFDQPVQAWRVLAISGAQGRFEALHSRGLTPLVGREHELGLLLGLWQQAKQGEGQIVLVGGEAGIGKSRLAQAVRERLRTEPHTRMRFHCSRFDTNNPLHPIVQGLERVARFDPADPAELRLDKLERLLSQAADASAELRPLLAALLSIPFDDRYPPLTLSSDLQKERTLDALVQQLVSLTMRKPVLLIFEDLHWIDPTSLELLDRLVRSMQSLPLLGLFTFRPDFAPSWLGAPHVTGITLNRLGRRQGAELVERVVKAKRLPPLLVDQIVLKADGVPLFVEELTKTMVGSGLLADRGDHYELTGEFLAPAIPSSLEASLMARLDQLGQAKEVAQIGAVIGREFAYDMVASLVGLSGPALELALTQLTEAGLVHCKGRPPRATYSFKHALIQDAAYHSLLKSRRQLYHRQLFRQLTEPAAATSEAHPELLAHHATEGGLPKEAIEHWWRAGRKAMLHSAHVEAIAHFQKGLSLLRELPDSASLARQELGLETALGQALMATKGYAASDVEAAYARAHAVGARLGDVKSLFSILTARGLIHATRGEWPKARDLVDQCMQLAQQGGEPRARLLAHQLTGITLLHMGELAPALDHLDSSVALYDATPRRSHGRLQDPKVDCLSFGAWLLWLLGFPDQALERDAAARAFADELDHPFSQAFALTLAAGLRSFRREPDQQLVCAEAARAISAERGFTWLSACATVLAGAARARLDGNRQALAEIRRGLAAYRATEARSQLPYLVWLHADASWACGDGASALAAVDEALAMAEQSAERWWLPEIYRLKGEIACAMGGPGGAAAAWCERARQLASEQQAKLLELRAVTSLSRICLQEGHVIRARDLLAPLHDWFAEGHCTPDVRAAEDLLRDVA